VQHGHPNKLQEVGEWGTVNPGPNNPILLKITTSFPPVQPWKIQLNTSGVTNYHTLTQAVTWFQVNTTPTNDGTGHGSSILVGLEPTVPNGGSITVEKSP